MTRTGLFLSMVLLCFTGLVWSQTEGDASGSSMGKLRLQGTFITELVLERRGDNQQVSLTDPNEMLTLPVGTYRVRKITLQGTHTYDSHRHPAPSLEALVISEVNDCNLDVGGPLTPSVDITRKGRQLVLAYKRVGRGGEIYEDLSSARLTPPKFTVYHGKKVFHTGTFEYG
ncbi:hypothetical protein ACFL6U_00930 [Planctomycetota bacterium]